MRLEELTDRHAVHIPTQEEYDRFAIILDKDCISTILYYSFVFCNIWNWYSIINWNFKFT